MLFPDTASGAYPKGTAHLYRELCKLPGEQKRERSRERAKEMQATT